MRTLCLDPGGILGILPSPVLFPEYGDQFVHVPELGGEHADALSDFLHAGLAADAREIWVLCRPSDERYVIERVATQLRESLHVPNEIRVYGVLVAPVGSGPENADFFDPNRPVEKLQYFASVGRGLANWHTLALGYRREADQSGVVEDLRVALSLRCWLDRRQLSQEWKQDHYRALVDFCDEERSDKLTTTLTGLRKNWQEAFGSLQARATELRTRPCQCRLLGKPEVSWMPFENRKGPQQALLCSLSRCLAIRSANGCLTCFLRDADRENAHLWLRRLFAQINDAIRSSWKAADTSFREQLRRIHDGVASDIHSESEASTPWEKVKALETELAELSACDSNNSSLPRTLLADIERAERGHLAQLFEALRCRPAGKTFLGCVGGSLLVIVGLIVFREIGMTVMQPQAFDGRLWLVGAALMWLVAVAWGLWRAQRPVRDRCDDAVRKRNDFWIQAEKIFLAHRNSLDQELRKVVTMRNLETVRAEMTVRDLELAQLEYHIDRLALYSRAYGGGELIAQKSDSTPPLSLDQPEAANPVYHWRNPGVSIDTATLPDHNAPRVWENHRLAGVCKFSVTEISPRGRNVAGDRSP